MDLYFAPLEGITTYTYRNTHAEMFGGCSAYFAPFINPSDLYKVSRKGEKDIFPENNEGINLRIQVLTNKAESFLRFAERVKELGYSEININLGCPAATVTRKGRGSGFLQNPDELDEFFYEIFSKGNIDISVKTRIGYESCDEMDNLMRIYNKYPLSQLIIHPRTRSDFYDGVPNEEVFEKSYKISNCGVCYNGNIFTAADYERIKNKFPHMDGVMLGRGAVRNPAVFREIRGGKPVTTDEIVEFTERLAENYMKRLNSQTFTLHKLKEIWVYILNDYETEKKTAKAMKKTDSLSEFISLARTLPPREK